MVIAIAALTVILQAIFIYHVIKNDHPYWWCFIILSFPVLGCIVYYFMEIFPDTNDARKAEKLLHNLRSKSGGNEAFVRRMHELEICGSVGNRIALARECMQRGMYDDAARLYQNCLQGPYAEDANLRLGLAEAHIEQGRFQDAQLLLDQLQAKDPGHKPNEAALLRARALEGLNDAAGALRIYEGLLPVYVGLEARYRHGVLLGKLGHTDQARNALGEMQAHAHKHRLTHEAELAWLDRARRDLSLN